MRNKIIALAVGTALMSLTACGQQSTPAPKPQLNSGTIVDIIKHDDVESKSKVCVKQKSERVRKNGKTKTVTTCAKYKTVTHELKPEWYEFKLKDGSRTGWVSVDEDTGESYEKGDQYP